jgi:hypothetical protein
MQKFLVKFVPQGTLHTFHDKSVMRKMSAKELVKIPVWKGNRTIDLGHVEKIREALGGEVERLDSGYRIIHYKEEDTEGRIIKQSYLIDGQHRARILMEHFLDNMCEADFDVVVVEKTVESETEAIEYFNAINNVKPQHWRTDPAILVNRYIAELEKCFNTKSVKFIRPGRTRRPYMSADDLRDILKGCGDLEQECGKIQEFGRRAIQKNEELLKEAPALILANTKLSNYYESALGAGFMLAVDPKMRWVREIL